MQKMKCFCVTFVSAPCLLIKVFKLYLCILLFNKWLVEKVTISTIYTKTKTSDNFSRQQQHCFSFCIINILWVYNTYFYIKCYVSKYNSYGNIIFWVLLLFNVENDFLVSSLLLVYCTLSRSFSIIFIIKWHNLQQFHFLMK